MNDDCVTIRKLGVGGRRRRLLMLNYVVDDAVHKRFSHHVGAYEVQTCIRRKSGGCLEMFWQKRWIIRRTWGKIGKRWSRAFPERSGKRFDAHKDVNWISHVDWIPRHAFTNATQFLFHALKQLTTEIIVTIWAIWLALAINSATQVKKNQIKGNIMKLTGELTYRMVRVDGIVQLETGECRLQSH